MARMPFGLGSVRPRMRVGVPAFACVHASTQAAPPRQGWSKARASVLALGALAAGYGLGALYPPDIARIISPRTAPPRPPADSEEGQAITKKVEADLHALALVRDLQSRKSLPPERDAQGDQVVAEGSEDTPQTHNAHYRLSRPYEKYPEERRQHSLTASTLRGPGLMAAPPVVLTKTAHGAAVEGGHAGDSTVLFHVGRSLCGHDGVVHGGLIATLFDESMARSAFHVLPAHVGVTARLELNYRAPTFADQNIVLQTYIQHSQGRKAKVTGTLRTTDGKLLAEAEGLFVQPKMSQFLNTSLAKEFLDLEETLSSKTQ